MFPGNPSRFDSRIHAGLSELKALHDELDKAVAKALDARPLTCPSGCAVCCKVPQKQIEASVLEMLPLAMEAWETGRAADLLVRTGETDGPCALLWTTSTGRGGCSAYDWRPLTCRLFGFSVIANPRQGKLLLACGILKASDEGKVWQAALGREESPQAPDSGPAVESPEESLPLAQALRLQANNLNPRYGMPLLGINEALHEALGIAGLRYRFSNPEQSG